VLLTFVLRRLLASIPVVVGVTLITFVLLHFTGGGYVPGISDNPRLTKAAVDAMRHAYGLDQPWPVQYGIWLWDVAHADFGRSMLDGTSVTSQVLAYLPNTLELTLTAILLAAILSVPAGAVAAVRRGTKLDNLLTTFSVAGVAVPAFWLGLMLILLVAVLPAQRLGAPILPSSGAVSAFGGGGLLDRLQHLVLPATVLAISYVAVWSRFTRSSMLEVLSQDYIRTAVAKGMGRRRLIYMHALRNALIPLVTLIGLELPGFFSGGVITEVVFGWPGLGLYAYQHALAYDYTTVMGVTTFGAILVVAGNLLSDVLYAILDPRIQPA
jgi:peptide/nickel transport system permease protein